MQNLIDKLIHRIQVIIKVDEGFTLIELLVVIVIISILSSILIVAINPREQIDKAHDAQRLSDMRNIQLALDLYLLENGQYPAHRSNNCGGWDAGNQSFQLLDGLFGNFRDPEATGACNGYQYYRYPAGHGGCIQPKEHSMLWG